MVSNLYGGKGPGLLSVGISALAFDYFFLPPLFQASFEPFSSLRFSAFLGTALLATALIQGKRRVEGSSRELNAQYRAIADTAPDAIISIDAGGLILFVNPAATRTFGWAASELIGQPLTILMPKFRLVMPLSGAEWIGQRKDGTQFPAEVFFGEVTGGDQSVFTGFVRDISERKRAEAALQKSESYLAEAQKLSHTGSWACKADLEITYWSAEMFRMRGLPPRDNPPHLEDIAKFYGPETWTRLEQMLQTARQKKINFDGEFPIILPDRSNRMLRIVGHPVLNAAGDIVEFVGTTIDITEQREARVALHQAFDETKKSEDRLREIISTIPALAWSTLPDGAAEFLNQRWLDYTGRSAEQALNWEWKVAIHPDDLPGMLQRYGEALDSGQSFELEGRLRRFDGEFRWFLFRGSPFRDESGKLVRWYGTNTDIEDRKRAEELLRASEQNLRLIVNSIPGQVYTRSAGGELERVNQPILDYTGKTLEELKEWPVVHPDDAARVVGLWNYSILTGSPLDAEVRVRRADGVYRWFHARGLPLRDTGGHVVRWYSLLTDIEDRKNAEEALRIAQERLSTASQLATVAELAASIAHDVNQPLSAVVANGHACLRWLSAQPPNLAKAQEAAERIVRDGKDAGEVVRRVRSLFKRTAVDKVALDLNEVIGEVLRHLRGETARRRVTVETDLESDLPPVRGDRVKLQQLVLNLFLNGLEAVDPVVDSPRKLFVRSKRQDPETALVEIRDYGVGIEAPDRVFEAFFTTKENGMGMGLAICRSIIDAHNDRLWARGETPGATFCFTLPFKASAAA